MQPLMRRPDYGDKDSSNKPQDFTESELRQLAEDIPEGPVIKVESVLLGSQQRVMVARELLAIAEDITHE